MNLLRSALWGQADKSGRLLRPVTWNIAGDEELSVDFEGSIIFTGNRPLGQIPELRALATRIDVIELVVSYEEIVARMKQVSFKGFKTNQGQLTSAQCCEVSEIFLEEWPADLVPDMRLLVLAFRKRIGVESLRSKITQSWQHLMKGSIRQAVRARTAPDKPVRQRLDDSFIPKAIELSKLKLSKKELTRKWKEIAGKPSLDSYYYLLRKVK